MHPKNFDDTDASFTHGNYHREMNPEARKDRIHERDKKLGRLEGVNRFGEYRPHSPYDYPYPEDETGMHHPFENDSFHRWSDDIRSEASHEKTYRGKGPKNYTRSDASIREEICEGLTSNPYIDATDVEVHVSEGIVSLSGAVNKKSIKRLIEDLAEVVTGVKDVHNHISVRKDVDGFFPKS